MTRMFTFEKKTEEQINLFINKKIIQVSPFISLYHLREIIKDKLFKVDHDIEINIYLKGKRLLENSDSISLYQLGIKNNDSISSLPSVRGGSNTTYKLLWFIYYLCLIGYVFFLLSGFITLFANIFSVTFNGTIFSVLDYFTKNKESIFIQGIRLFIRFVSWILKIFSTLFFVWILTAYMIFPWFYGKANKYCESALASKRVGWWTMFIFTIIYMYMNIGDVFFNISQAVAEEAGIKLVEATVSPPIQTFKNIWDRLKNIIFTMLPGVSSYHGLIESAIYSLYTYSSEIGQFDCGDPISIKKLCKYFQNLNNVMKNKRTKDATQTISSQEQMAGTKSTLKNYHLGPGIELLSVGFCDLADQYIAKEKGMEYVPKDINDEYEPGSFNRWSAGFFTSFFCQIAEATIDFSNTLNSVGTDNQVVNMIETGNVAGIGAVIYLIVIIIYTFFSNSFAGFKFGK